VLFYRLRLSPSICRSQDAIRFQMAPFRSTTLSNIGSLALDRVASGGSLARERAALLSRRHQWFR